MGKRKFSEDGFRGNLYLDLMENGKATLTIKGAGTVEEEGVNMKMGMTAKVGGKWDASMGSWIWTLIQIR